MFVIGMIGADLVGVARKNPIMNLRLFKYKNFAICCLLMMLVGGVLNASTVLQPQFLQQLLGYTATNAGMALTGGGIALLVVMPFAGIATGKFPARNLVAMGFAIFCGFYLYVATPSGHWISASARRASCASSRWRRFPSALSRSPTAAYVGLPRESRATRSRA